ncbi:MAG TPA: DUF308 domain-containing protein [Methylomirabilota bacterium]|jgi:uncharacterized membrane protein HdeD (DUF308 family)|nr:DUF308 domain-containing protein [Methylomirabilota bacterium]
MLLVRLADHWWTFLLRGLAGIVFGLMALFWPGLTAITLVLLFGAYTFIDGVVAVATALSTWKTNEDASWVLLHGLLGLLVGVLTWWNPAVTGLGLLVYIVGWCLASGMIQLFAGIRGRKAGGGAWWLILAGALSVVFALLVMRDPLAGALAVVWMIGLYAIAFGISLVAFSLALKRHLVPARA